MSYSSAEKQMRFLDGTICHTRGVVLGETSCPMQARAYARLPPVELNVIRGCMVRKKHRRPQTIHTVSIIIYNRMSLINVKRPKHIKTLFSCFPPFSKRIKN